MFQQSSQSYTVQYIHGCRVVFGALPLADFQLMGSGFSKNAVCATELAEQIGASFVFGEVEDVVALSKLGLPASASRQLDARLAEERGLFKVAEWLRNGRRGQSSNAMCKHIFGIPLEAGTQHPCDPSDLQRCFAFIEATGTQDKISMMATVSPQWSALIAIWSELEALLHSELHSGKSAPLTYALIRKALGA